MSRVDKEIADALKDFQKDIYGQVRQKVYVFARDLVVQAIVERQNYPGKHNFTGNLINSITVCVYEDGKPDVAYYGGQYVPQAIRFKMTAPRHYHFTHDYDGDESNYDPEVKTNEGWGVDDAREFFQEYRPQRNSKFCIVVAYPTEYANFVENLRHTTGFTGTYMYARKWGVRMLSLPIDYSYGANSSSSNIEVPF